MFVKFFFKSHIHKNYGYGFKDNGNKADVKGIFLDLFFFRIFLFYFPHCIIHRGEFLERKSNTKKYNLKIQLIRKNLEEFKSPSSTQLPILSPKITQFIFSAKKI
jgi:hypothetical protein